MSKENDVAWDAKEQKNNGRPQSTQTQKKNSISFLFVDINKISPMNRIEQMKMAISYKDEAAKSAQRQQSSRFDEVSYCLKFAYD